MIIAYPGRIHNQRTSFIFAVFHGELTLVTHYISVLGEVSSFVLEVTQILVFILKNISCATFTLLRLAYLLI